MYKQKDNYPRRLQGSLNQIRKVRNLIMIDLPEVLGGALLSCQKI